MTVLELDKKLKAVNKDLLKTQAAEENKEYLADLNKIQLTEGKTTKNTAIKPSYSPKYAAFKQSLGTLAPFGTPDLKLSGAFHKGIEYVAEGNQYYAISQDEKTRFLVAPVGRYDNILGLSKENQQKATIKVTKSFVKLWKKSIGLS